MSETNIPQQPKNLLTVSPGNYKFDEAIHLHLYNRNGEWVPLTGTSSVVGVLAKVLTWWASGLAVGKLGWIKKVDPRKSTKEEIAANAKERLKAATKALNAIKKMTPTLFLALLDEAYKAHSVKLKDSATAGTDLHAELEAYVKGKMGIAKVRKYDDKIKPFVDWADANVKKFLWSEAHCFDPELWVGGICDAGAELNDGSIALIDFKSAKEAYDSHFIQAAGYTYQIDKNGLWDSIGSRNKRLEKPVEHLVIVPFGAEVIIPQFKNNVADYKQGFINCVQLYRLLGMDKK